MDHSVIIGGLAGEGGGGDGWCGAVGKLSYSATCFLVCEVTSLCTMNIQKRAGGRAGRRAHTRVHKLSKSSLLPTVCIHHRLSRDTLRRLLLTEVNGPAVVAEHGPLRTAAGPG
jgi:hypothetical protein